MVDSIANAVCRGENLRKRGRKSKKSATFACTHTLEDCESTGTHKRHEVAKTHNVGGDECPTTKVEVAAILQADHPRTGERGGLSAANDMLHLAMMILWEKQRGAFREAFLEWLFSFDPRMMFKMFRSKDLLLTSRNICDLGLCLGKKEPKSQIQINA